MLYILALIIIEGLLFFTNYAPDTWLVGWDNVMPEFNLELNLKRAFFSLWQDYRGLGLVDGMAHTANFMHTLYIAILSVVFPDHLLRYIFIILTHLLGGIGMYVLLQRILRHKSSAFLGSLFYMFNLGIIQMYYAPLEVFAIHFTALPWITFTLLNALEKPDYQRLGIFFLTCFLLTPQSFVPTVFIAFSILIGVILLFDLYFSRNIRKICIILSLVFAANAFWLIPYFYSIKYSASEIPETKINQFSSEEIYYRNKEFGTLEHVLMFKGFMFNTPEIETQTNTYVPFLEAWISHTNGIVYKSIWALVLLVSFGGLYKSIRDKTTLLLPFGIVWITAFFFLANDTFILESMNEWIRDTFPLLGEAFRFPFTKFITIFTFCTSIFFTYGIFAINTFFPSQKMWGKSVLVGGSLIVLYLSFPAFEGRFFSPLLRLRIPNDYFETIAFFKDIPSDKRIAMLPAESFWNWEYRNWGHRGSGFLWYGISQPLLMRPFDPWSTNNEQFYNEIHYAFQRKDRTMLDNALTKYSVEYLIVDKSIVNAGKPKAIDYQKLTTFLETSLLIDQVQTGNTLDIYQVSIPPAEHDISILKKPPHINPVFTYTHEDLAYHNYGSYITDLNSPEVIYPFTSLFTEKTQKNLEISLSIQDEAIVIHPAIPLHNNDTLQNYHLNLPSTDVDPLIPVRVDIGKNTVTFTTLYPEIIMGNTLYTPPVRTHTVALGTIESPSRIELTESGQIAYVKDSVYLLADMPNTIKVIKGSEVEFHTVETSSLQIPSADIPVQIPKEDTTQVRFAKIISAGSTEQNYESIHVASGISNTELVMWNADMFHNTGYVLTVDSTWNHGLPLSFYIDNTFEKRAEMDTLLSKGNNAINTFILPPIDPYHRGYGVHMIAKTMGNTRSETVVHNFRAYPIPFNYLKNISLKKTNDNPVKTIHQKAATSKLRYPFLYSLEVDGNADDYIFLDQQYQDGWIGIYGCKLYVIGCKFLDHVKVNNWANGWRLPNEEKPTIYTLIFWPQYLHFAGLSILMLTGLFFLIKIANTTKIKN